MGEKISGRLRIRKDRKRNMNARYRYFGKNYWSTFALNAKVKSEKSEKEALKCLRAKFETSYTLDTDVI